MRGGALQEFGCQPIRYGSGGCQAPLFSDSLTNGFGPVLAIGGRADLPGLIVGSDPALPCIALFLLGRVNEAELTPLLQTMPDPAVPIAHFGDCSPVRSDFVADALDITTLAETRLRFAPIIRRLRELPFQAAREDRAALLTLRLAFSRDCPIEADFAPGEKTVIKYPLLHSRASARAGLEALAHHDLLRRRHFIRTHSCHHCGSLRLLAHEACPGCGGSNLVDEAIIHHYRCGLQEAERAFVSGGSLICPKCRRELRHLGIDYGRPGTIVHCISCGAASQEPDPVFVCIDCHVTINGRQAIATDWFHYDLTDLGMQALRDGRLPAGAAQPYAHRPDAEASN